MGRIERKNAGGVVKYIWYPGRLDDWKRAAISIGVGAVAGVAVGMLFASLLVGVVVGTSATAAITGLSFGQKDARALAGLGTLKTPETGRSLWRALVKGFGTAFAAVLVVHATDGSGVMSWILPLVPAIVAAVSHQFGMMQFRMSEEATAKKKARKALFPKEAAAA